MSDVGKYWIAVLCRLVRVVYEGGCVSVSLDVILMTVMAVWKHITQLLGGDMFELALLWFCVIAVEKSPSGNTSCIN